MYATNWPLIDELFSVLQKIYPCRGWYWDFSSQRLLWTRNDKLLPGSPESLPQLLDCLTDKNGRKRLQTLFTTKAESGTQADILTQVKTGSGQILLRWYACSVGDAGIFGIILNEQEQRLNNTKLAVLDVLFKQAEQIVCVADSALRIYYANPFCYQHLGYTGSELQKLGLEVFKSDQQNAEFYQQMETALQQQGEWQGELWSKKKDGSAYLQQLKIVRLRDSREQLLGFVCVGKDITSQHQRERAVRRLAYYDTHSGLPNTAMLRKQLPRMAALADKSGQRLALLVISVREFDNIADINGEGVATTLSRMLADRLKRYCGRLDMVARLASDLFAVTISGMPDDETLLKLLPQLTQLFSVPFQVDDEEYFLGCSIGVSLYRADATSPTQLVTHATQAMYTMRQSSKNDYVFFSSSLQSEVKRQLQLVQALRKTLADKSFTVLFQPIIDCRSGRLIKVEAFFSAPKLAKEYKTNTFELIQLAERYSEVRNIDNAVAEYAIKEFAVFRQLSKTPISLCINRSMSYGHHADDVRQLLADTDIPPRQLTVEVTETVFFYRAPELADELTTLTELGVQLSLDDFGTGNSSLTALVSMPFQSLKIDRSLIKSADESPTGEDLVVASIRLAKGLGLRVIAEGVESTQHADWLSHSGCDELQGWAFARPLTGTLIRAFIQKAELSPVYQASLHTGSNNVANIYVEVPVIDADVTVGTIRDMLEEVPCRILLVRDEGQLVGIIDECALAAALSPFTGTDAALPRDDAILHHKAHQVMQRAISTVRVDTSIEAASRLLEQKPEPALTVVDETMKICGVVTRTMLLTALRKMRF